MASTAPFTHPHHHASHLSHSPRWRCHRSVGTTPHYLADQHRPLPPQTHAGHIPHHALSRPPLQAQGGREVANRQCEPGVSTQVRVNRSGPRVVRAVGRRAPVCCLGLCCGVSREHTNNNAANLGGGWSLMSMAGVLLRYECAVSAIGHLCCYLCRHLSKQLGAFPETCTRASHARGQLHNRFMRLW